MIESFLLLVMCFQWAGASEQSGWQAVGESPVAQQRPAELRPGSGQNPSVQPASTGLQMVQQGKPSAPQCAVFLREKDRGLHVNRAKLNIFYFFDRKLWYIKSA